MGRWGNYQFEIIYLIQICSNLQQRLDHRKMCFIYCRVVFECKVKYRILLIWSNPTEIVTNPKDQALRIGEKTTLSCDAVRKLVPNITFSGENVTVVHSKKLVVNSSCITYFKIYTCTAFNEYRHQYLSLRLLLCWVSVVCHVCFTWFLRGGCLLCLIQWEWISSKGI